MPGEAERSVASHREEVMFLDTRSVGVHSLGHGHCSFVSVELVAVKKIEKEMSYGADGYLSKYGSPHSCMHDTQDDVGEAH